MPSELTFSNRLMNPQPTDPAKKKKRAGLMKAIIGSQHNIRCTDGKVRSFKVRDYRDFPKAQTIAVCLGCEGPGRHKTWKTAEEAVSAHPEHAVMEKQAEAHVLVLWSDDPLDDSKLVKKGEKAEPPGYDNRVGFLSDEFPASV